MADTRVELVAELEKVTPRTALIERMLEEAKAGEFHDFKNVKYVCGKLALAELLYEAGLHDIRKRVIHGDYDESPDAEDRARLDADFPEFFEGRP